MNNSINCFDEDDRIEDLSEIRNRLSQSEKEEIEFLLKDYVEGEWIPRKCNSAEKSLKCFFSKKNNNKKNTNKPSAMPYVPFYGWRSIFPRVQTKLFYF